MCKYYIPGLILTQEKFPWPIHTLQLTGQYSDEKCDEEWLFRCRQSTPSEK